MYDDLLYTALDYAKGGMSIEEACDRAISDEPDGETIVLRAAPYDVFFDAMSADGLTMRVNDFARAVLAADLRATDARLSMMDS